MVLKSETMEMELSAAPICEMSCERAMLTDGHFMSLYLGSDLLTLASGWRR